MANNDYGCGFPYYTSIYQIVFWNCNGFNLNETTSMFSGIWGRFAPLYIVVVGLDIQWVGGAPATGDTPKISIGTNDSKYDNVIPNIQLGGLLTTEDSYIILASQKSKMPLIDDQLSLKINEVANPAKFLTYTFHTYLFGIDVNI